MADARAGTTRLDQETAHRPGPARTFLAFAGVLGGVLAAVALVLWEPWHGPILISLVSNRGVDTGDLLAVPILILVALLLRRTSRTLARAGSPGPRHQIAYASLAVGAALIGAQAARLVDLDERRPGRYLLVVAILSLLGWLWLAVMTGTAPASLRGTKPWILGGLLLAGLLLDASLAPSGTVFSVAAVATYLALRSPSAMGSIVFGGLAGACFAASLVSLTDLAGIDVRMAKDEGGVARALAFGILLLLIGLLALRPVDAGSAEQTGGASLSRSAVDGDQRA